MTGDPSRSRSGGRPLNSDDLVASLKRKLEVLIPLDADILELTPDDAIENERSKMRSTSAH